MEGKLAALLAGKDHEELATQVGVAAETTRRWFNGEALPYRRILPAVSVATGIPLEELRRARALDRAARKATSEGASA